VHPSGCVIEHAGGGAVHVVTGFLPRLKVPNDRATVPPKGLEVGGSFDQVDRGTQCVGVGLGLECRCKSATNRALVSLRVGAVGQPEASLCIERVLRKGGHALLHGRMRIARPSEHVGNATRYFLAIGAPQFEPIKLLYGGLVVASSERAVQIDLCVGVELLDPGRDLVGLSRGPVLVEHVKVGAQGAGVVGKAKSEVLERARLLALPAQPPVDLRKLLEQLRFAAHFVRKLAQRVNGLGQALLLGAFHDCRSAGTPQERVAREGTLAQRARPSSANVFRKGRIVDGERGGHL